MSRNLKSLKDFLKSKAPANQTFERDHALYPFWNLKYKTSSTVRLLPDGDETNQAPWTTKKLIPCTFVDPEDDSKIVYFNVPCREMYEPGKCPALQPVRDLWTQSKKLAQSGNTLESERVKKIASKHWLDQTFYHAGLIMKAGFVEEGRPADASPIRVLPFTKQIQGVVETNLGLSSDENAPPSQFRDDELPCGTFSMSDVNRVLDGEVPEDEIEQMLAKFRGYPFVIIKNQKGDFANYEASRFEMRDPHDLDMDTLRLIQQHGLPNLNKYLPARPTDEQYDVLVEIVKASIASEPWNPDWESQGLKFFRKKDRNGGTSTEGGEAAKARPNSIADRVKANIGGSDEGSASLAAAMNRRRATTTTKEEAVAEEAPAAEETVTPVATAVEAPAEAAPAAETPKLTNSKDPKALAAFIKSQLGKAKA